MAGRQGKGDREVGGMKEEGGRGNGYSINQTQKEVRPWEQSQGLGGSLELATPLRQSYLL